MLKQFGQKPHFFNKLTHCKHMADALNALEQVYVQATKTLSEDFGAFAKDGTLPTSGAVTYPYLLIHIRDDKPDGILSLIHI